MTVTLQFAAPGDFDISGDLIAWFNAGTVDHVDAVMPDGSLLGAQSPFHRRKAGGRVYPPCRLSRDPRSMPGDAPCGVGPGTTMA